MFLTGLLGGACASARVPAEEHGNREQEAEDPAGRASGPQPTGEEGTGVRSSGASGAAVSKAIRGQCLLCLLWEDHRIKSYFINSDPYVSSYFSGQA